MIRRIRFHGRGGEGVKLASHIVSRAAFLAGSVVQDSPVYGAERRGAPVVGFVRVSDRPILERGYVEQPDVVVLMDASLLDDPDANVCAGLERCALLLINGTGPVEALCQRHGIAARVVALDVSSIALEVLGQHLLSAPMAGFAAKAAAVAPWELLAEAVRTELGTVGIGGAALERNLTAAHAAFERTPPGDVPSPAPAVPRPSAPLVVPRWPARDAAPSISAGATSARRGTEGWRVYRPVIDRARCTRCFLCFALCPEGAIQLDADNFPLVDYHHCKGCLVCVAECPPEAITQVREHAA